jgi:flagellar biogenesis protein FliO
LASATRRRTAKRAVQVTAPIADAMDLEEEVEETNYALALTEALEAISAAQAQPVEVTYTPVRKPHAARPAAKPARAAKPATAAAQPESEPAVTPAAAVAVEAITPVADGRSLAAVDDLEALVMAEPAQGKGFRAFVAALDKLPPIRLPIGPAIPWRYGLPLLFGALLLMVVVARPQGQPEKVGTSQPAQQTYAVQQESPLFAKPAPEAASAPVGVPEPAATAGFDLFDVGIKFAAVLGLAYGSLMLLKKVGVGGSAAKAGSAMAGVRVVSSLALAPNRTVHVIRTPGGKSLLVGATPAQVNLIADLGELDEDTEALDSGSFFDILSSKLAK